MNVKPPFRYFNALLIADRPFPFHVISLTLFALNAGNHLKKNTAAINFPLPATFCGLIEFQKTRTRFFSGGRVEKEVHQT